LIWHAGIRSGSLFRHRPIWNADACKRSSIRSAGSDANDWIDLTSASRTETLPGIREAVAESVPTSK
jgi:hypothetical protein